VNHAATYERAYQRLRSLVGDDDADVEVPTCPGWTVKDLIAHLADLFSVYASDGMEGFSQDWGERGVQARRDRSLEMCFEELAQHLRDPGDLFESHLARVAAADVLAHEQDIRNALGRPGAEDDEGIVGAIELALTFVEKQTEDESLPTLRIVTDDVDHDIGSGDPAVTLRTSTLELFRTLHGRRTIDQMRALDWEGDPDPWIPHLAIFGPTESVVEK
jgi:uncharacterized protein (TIGR03083 family)